MPSHNGITILTLNNRSIPTNFQGFADNILCNMNTHDTILGLTEMRLSPHLTPLYKLPGYSMFTSCRNTQGGGAALFVPYRFRPVVLQDFSKVDSFIECVGVEAIMNKKSLLLCIYRSPNGSIDLFLNTISALLSLAFEKKNIFRVLVTLIWIYLNIAINVTCPGIL